LMREPGIRSLHAVTCTNALHFAWQHCGSDVTRRYLLLQNAAFLPLYRGNSKEKIHIDELQATPLEASSPEALEAIFSEISKDRMNAARKLMS
ncbi:MAG: hypothetical protein DME19_00320, partial [Verrucomicrobia bacterium]